MVSVDVKAHVSLGSTLEDSQNLPPCFSGLPQFGYNISVLQRQRSLLRLGHDSSNRRHVLCDGLGGNLRGL